MSLHSKTRLVSRRLGKGMHLSVMTHTKWLHAVAMWWWRAKRFGCVCETAGEVNVICKCLVRLHATHSVCRSSVPLVSKDHFTCIIIIIMSFISNDPCYHCRLFFSSICAARISIFDANCWFISSLFKVVGVYLQIFFKIILLRSKREVKLKIRNAIFIT